MRKVLLLLFILTLYAYAYNQVKVYTYQECIDMALSNNKQVIDAQYQQQRIQQQANYNVFSEIFPTVKFTGTYQYMLAVPYSYINLGALGSMTPGATNGYVRVTTGIPQTMSGTILLSQPIYNHAIFIGMKSIQYMNNQATIQMEATEENIAYNTGVAYYNLQIAMQQEALLDSNIVLLEESLKGSQSLYDNHLISKNDYNKIVVNLENLKNDKRNAILNETKLQNLLKYLMGLPINDTLQIINFNPNDTIANIQVSADPYTVVNRRTDVRAQELQIQLDEINKRVAFANFIPTLSLNMSAGYAGFYNSFNPIKSIADKWPFSSYISLNLNYTLFQGMRAHYNYRDKKLAVLQSKNKLQDIKEQAIKEVMDNYADFVMAKNNFSKNKTTYELSNQIYAYEVSKYNQGLASLIELIQSQTEYTQARNNYLNAMVNLKAAQLNYQKAIGQMITPSSFGNHKK